MLCQCLFERLSQLQIDKDRSIIVAKFGTDFQVLAFSMAKWGIVGFVCVCVAIMDCGEGNYAKLKQTSLKYLKPFLWEPTPQFEW